MNNPYTLSFGKKPLHYISRILQTNMITDVFCAEHPSSQIYMVTGVRGFGKTVLMTTVANQMNSQPDWIVVELNPTRDLLHGLAAKLYALPEMRPLFIKAKLDLSVLGIGIAVEGAVPVSDEEQAIGLMLEQMAKAGKRLLVTIDEVTNSEYIRIFASAFQIFLRQDYPIFLLMTGLYENIYDLQNDKALTFLYRAPKLQLEPLNYTAVRTHYMNIFDISSELAEQLTLLTRGYPFAFQVLGYIYWERRESCSIEEIMPEYDQYLEEYVYSKIWAEMSERDREVLAAMSEHGEERVKNIREITGMSSAQFAVYRDRLKRKGVIDTSQYGKISLVLPRFEEYVKRQREYM